MTPAPDDISSFSGLRVAAFESRMAAEMARLIARHGGEPLVAPALREMPLEAHAEALQFGEQLLAGACDLLILTTGVGTKALVNILQTRHPLDRLTAALAQVPLVARGPKPVAALKALGLAPALVVPEPNTWRELLALLDREKPVSGLRVAVQEYGASNADLLEGLRERGAMVTAVPVYRWALPEDLAPLRRALAAIMGGDVAVLLVTNAAQVDHVMQLVTREGGVERFREALRRMVVGSIGPPATGFVLMGCRWTWSLRIRGWAFWSKRPASRPARCWLASGHRRPGACALAAACPASPAASFAQRNPSQFILVLGSVPFRWAARTLGVLSIHPPPRKLRCVPFSGPLGFRVGPVL